MAKGYNPNKAKEKQQARAETVATSNFGENVLGNLTREFEIPKASSEYEMVKIDIHNLYSAPNNKEWDGFDKLKPDEEANLIQAIYEHGQIEPIIVWEINRDEILDEYTDDVPKYGFDGKQYMILAGHSRTNSFYKLYKETQEEQFKEIKAIIRKNITKDTAKYIIKVTNLLKRDLSNKDRREGIEYLYRKLNTVKTKGMNIAKKIAEDSGLSLRTVQYQISINEKLIQPFIEMYDGGKLSQTNVLKITGINNSLQQWMYDKYNEQITNDVMKNFQKYFDRKELIDTLFVDKEIEYTNVNIEIPAHLDKKFREMARKWIKRNI